MAVFVLDRHKKPLMPCTEKRARLLLARKRARVHRLHPFTTRLVDRRQAESALQPLRLKLDPGSQRTGMALVRELTPGTHEVLHLADLEHRGARIRQRLAQRRAYRRRRRGANLRYRAPRCFNRRRRKGWLAPSLQHRVETVATWVARYRRWAPITALTLEHVRFDAQALVNPAIQGMEYQQGTLAGYELREYLLEKWGRQCAYCGMAGLPLQVEHITPKSLGGSDRVSNLTLSCGPCNNRKGNQPVVAFLAKQPNRLAQLLAQAQAPLTDAAAVNATRWAIWRRLTTAGLPLEAASGGRTKWNRTRFGIRKTHALDAVCAGVVDQVTKWQCPVLTIRGTGRESHQRTRLTAHGFPRGILMRQKAVQGFRTGDLVRATVPTGVHAGIHTGRVAVRATGNFNIQTPTATMQEIRARHCQLLQRADGYAYALTSGAALLRSPPDNGPGAATEPPLPNRKRGCRA